MLFGVMMGADYWVDVVAPRAYGCSNWLEVDEFGSLVG